MKTVQVATVNTYPEKDRLRNCGFNWHKEEKVWVRFTNLDHPYLDDEIEESFQGTDVRIVTIMADFFMHTTVDLFHKGVARPVQRGWVQEVEARLSEMEKVAAGSELSGPEDDRISVTIVVGSKIQLPAWIAKAIGKELGLTHVFRNLLVTEVLRETPKAYQVRVRFMSEIAKVCHLCGTQLDDPLSQATGIGPVCAKKIGIKRATADKAKEVLNGIREYVESVGEVGPVWISKTRVKILESTE